MYVKNLLKVLTQQCAELESKCGPRGHQFFHTLLLLYQTTQNSNLLKTYFSALFINVPCTLLTIFLWKGCKILHAVYAAWHFIWRAWWINYILWLGCVCHSLRGVVESTSTPTTFTTESPTTATTPTESTVSTATTATTGTNIVNAIVLNYKGKSSFVVHRAL